MKTILKKWQMLLMLVLTLGITACSDDNGGNGDNGDDDGDNLSDILFENGIEWDNASMREVDTSALDGKCITALLMGAIRADRFSEGALLHFFETGTITKWLNRLKEIDEKKSLD